MCHQCVIDGVKKTMLSRRSMLTGATAVGALGVTASLMSAPQARAQARGRVIDLTHAYDADFPTFDGEPGILIEEAVNFEESGYQLKKLTIFEHTGTHIDAPLHFSADGMSVDELEPQSLVCPLCIIDITTKALDDANATVDAQDVETWVSENGEFPAGSLVAMRSGWAAKVGNPSFRNDEAGHLAFPGFSVSATNLLAGQGVVAIGVDTLSLDPGNSVDFAVHYAWLGGGMYGIECLNGLDELPVTGATVFVGAPKHRGGTGGPARVLAVI